MRLAIIGAQHNHVLGIARSAIQQPDVELIAVAEPEESVRDEVAAEFGIRALADYRELLEGPEIDAALLAPINNQKPELTADCLAAGVHVLVDKPAVTDIQGLERIEAAEKAGGAVLFCALTQRFNPAYVLAKRAIDEGEIGAVVNSMAQSPHKLGMLRRPDWFFSREQNGGVIVDLAIHAIDVIRWFHGSEPVAVAAGHGAARFTQYPDFTDHCELLLQMEDGTAGFVKGSWLTPDEARWHGDYRHFVEGTEGFIEIRGSAEELLTINSRGQARTLTDFARGDQINPAEVQGTLIGDFLSAIAGNPGSALSARDVIESHRWALLARQAADSSELVRPG